MKYFIPLSFIFLLFSCGNVDEAVNSQDDDQPWSFEQIESFILEEFPEAYKQFLSISYSRSEDTVYPEEANFLIPSKYFDQGKLSQEICLQRTENIIQKMGSPATCEMVEIGKSKEYAWHAWEDKVVTKVTIKFYIGC